MLTQLLCTENAARHPVLQTPGAGNLDSSVLEKALAALSQKRLGSCFDEVQRLHIGDSLLEAAFTSCTAAVAAFHKRNSALPGIKRNELATGWETVLQSLPISSLNGWSNKKCLGRKAKTCPQMWRPLTARKPRSAKAISKLYREAGLIPPGTTEMLEKLGISKKEALPVMAALRTSGQLVRVSEDICYDAAPLKQAEEAVRTWLETHENLDIAGLKSVLGLSRKYLMALLEYFYAQNLTLRVGDTRVLRKRKS